MILPRPAQALAPLLCALVPAQTPKAGGPFAVKLAKPKTTYQLYVPESYGTDHSWPLVVALHPARTPATAMMQWWLPEGKKRKYMVLCPKAKGPRWQDSDGKIVLAALADVRKKYRIDPDRIALGGYSSGAFMATRWGLTQDKLWRCVFAHAGAQLPGSLKRAKKQMSVYLTCGEADDFLPHTKKAYAALQKQKVPAKLRIFPDMNHYQTTAEVWKTAYDFIDLRTADPEERLRRGLRAIKSDRLSDALLALLPMTLDQSKANRKYRIKAGKLLTRADQAADKSITRALRDAKKQPLEARRALLHIQKWFHGRKPEQKARAALRKVGRR